MNSKQTAAASPWMLWVAAGVATAAITLTALREFGGPRPDELSGVTTLLPATIEAAGRTTVIATSPGRVVEVSIVPGQPVAQGDVLARLEDPDAKRS